MAANIFPRRAAAVPLDLAMAGFAALSVAFFLFAMPDPMLAGLLEGLGLTSGRAVNRWTAMAAGGASTFLLLWRFLGAIGGSEAAPRVVPVARFSRRPLVAASDVGEPCAASAIIRDDEPLSLVRDSILSGPIAAPAPADGDEEWPSIPELMDRLERGLAARRMAPPDTRLAPAESEPGSGAEWPLDHRLRSALDDLQRLTTRIP
jgi:hypothetical protein